MILPVPFPLISAVRPTPVSSVWPPITLHDRKMYVQRVKKVCSLVTLFSSVPGEAKQTREHLCFFNVFYAVWWPECRFDLCFDLFYGITGVCYVDLVLLSEAT